MYIDSTYLIYPKRFVDHNAHKIIDIMIKKEKENVSDNVINIQ